MKTHEWRTWWRKSGRRELVFLLWAAWDPIGGVPPDEYDDYADPDVSALRRPGHDYPAVVDEVAAVLESIRTEAMELEAAPEDDYEAAEKIFEWYDWRTERSIS